MDVFPIQRWKTVQQAGFGHFGATNSAKKIVTDRLFFKSNYFLYTYETYLGRRCEGAMGAVIPTIVIAPGSRSFALFGARTEHGVVLVVQPFWLLRFPVRRIRRLRRKLSKEL